METVTDYCFGMKKQVQKAGVAVLLFLSLFFTFGLHAQAFWTENFANGCASDCDAGSYTGTNGAWSVNTSLGTNGGNNNPWYVSSAEHGSPAGVCSSTSGSNECLHIGSNFSIMGDAGATFLNTGLSGTFNILTDLRAESPVINCTGQSNITLSFNYIENGDGTNDNATLWYYDGVSWSQLTDLAKTTACSPTTSTWTTYSQLLPTTSGNNSNVRIGFRWVNNDDATGDDPSFAVDDITLSTTTAATDSITTGAISAGPFCGCDTINVPFVSTGTFNAGNIYTVQLSDASGSFSAPVGIGSLASTANSGVVNVALPCNTTTGSGYLVRVSSSSPLLIGDDNGVAVTVNTAVTPSVSLSLAGPGSMCLDTVLFAATPVNGGSNPSYQWQLNGVNVGTDSTIYDPNAVLPVGDTVTVIMTSNAVCATDTVVEAEVVVNCTAVNAGVVAGSPFCSCDSVDIPFTSTGLFNAGNVYTAQLSDSLGSFASPVDIGTLSSTANSGTITAQIPCATLNGTNYLIRVTSSAPADTSAASASTLIINTVVVPSISMSTMATTALCIDTAVTFTATPVNGGAAPLYQWQRNGNNVGGNSPIYTTSGTFAMGDVITVIMVSNAACALPDSVQDFMIIDCPQIEIPNVFSPNDDGINDLFRVNLSGRALTNFKIDIYDRWGLLMFSSTNINNKWDGRTTSGQKVVNGTYFYVVDLNGTQYKGYLMVVQ